MAQVCAPAGRCCTAAGGGPRSHQPWLLFLFSLKETVIIKEGALGSCSPGKADTLLLLDCPSPYLAGELFSLWQVGGYDALCAPGVLDAPQPWARALGTHGRMASLPTAGWGLTGGWELLCCRAGGKAWLGRGLHGLCFTKGFLPHGVGGFGLLQVQEKSPGSKGRFWALSLLVSHGEYRGVSMFRWALPRQEEGDARRREGDGRAGALGPVLALQA